jgi:Tol biopolymer transport system component
MGGDGMGGGAARCDEGGARAGVTSCGLNGRGKLGQECDGGVWVDTSTCDDPDECTDGAERTLTNVCGANNQGDVEQTCVMGAWTGSFCDEVLRVYRASVSSQGAQGNDNSYRISVSGDGRYVAFQSSATNLVSGDTNSGFDIFVHDVETGITVRVSVSSSGEQGYGHSEYPSISADGRYVAFESWSSTLVSGDTNNTVDVFVHDLQTGSTSWVSVNGAGNQTNPESRRPSISASGRLVAFESSATNLVSGSTSGIDQIFVRDLEAGSTSLVSANGGIEGDGPSNAPSISADGGRVVFESTATNLAPGDTNGRQDVFVYDEDGGLTRVSVDAQGGDANGGSYEACISASGRYVAFTSHASDLVASDTNNADDVFVRDLETGTTTRVSVDSAGAQANSSSYGASLSADGRYVTFTSFASNLVAGDSNGDNDVFVHDRQTGSTRRLSVDAAGGQVQASSFGSSIAADGRSVAFASDAANLVSGDTNARNDVFVVPVP